MSYTAAISVIASNLRESDNNRRDVVVERVGIVLIWSIRAVLAACLDVIKSRFTPPHSLSFECVINCCAEQNEWS